DALNADGGNWKYVESPQQVPNDPDVIRVAFIYNPDRVEPVGESRIFEDERFTGTAREPLAQEFKPVDEDVTETFVAVANHFKSKGSIAGGDADQGDGQGNNANLRVSQAEAVLDHLAKQSDWQDKATFVMGDLNSYTANTPSILSATPATPSRRKTTRLPRPTNSTACWVLSTTFLPTPTSTSKTRRCGISTPMNPSPLNTPAACTTWSITTMIPRSAPPTTTPSRLVSTWIPPMTTVTAAMVMTTAMMAQTATTHPTRHLVVAPRVAPQASPPAASSAPQRPSPQHWVAAQSSLAPSISTCRVRPRASATRSAHSLTDCSKNTWCNCPVTTRRFHLLQALACEGGNAGFYY